MNIFSLGQILNTNGHSGIILSIEEINTLQNSLTILQKNNHFRNVYFWGKILAKNEDYYVAFGYTKDALHGQVYFYCTDGYEWCLLPKSTKASQLLTPLCVTSFQGDPTLVVDVSEHYKNAKSLADDLFKLDGKIIKKLKEEDRLAATVELINNDALIVPRGALFKLPDGTVVENTTYEGLSLPEAENITSYTHWRIPRFRWNTNLLTRADYNYALDFLDTIDNDIPKTSWSLQTKVENGGSLVLIRSLMWPGMVFYQRIKKPDHGSLYVGYGRKNLDIPFMLHKWD